MEKLTKDDIRGPDAFISVMDQVSHKLFDHRRELLFVLTVAILAGLGWAGFGTYTSKKEDAAAESLFGAEKTLKAEEKRFEVPPKANDAKGKDKKDAPPPKAEAERTGKIEQDYKDSINQLKDVITRFPGTQASVMATLDLTRIYHNYNQDDLALPLLENASKAAKHTVTKALVFHNYGVVLEAKNNCAGAIEQWQKIQDDKTMGPFQPNTMIKQALCYEKLGQKAKAEEIYKKFEMAEGERKQIVEAMASKYQLNLKMPLQMQPQNKVQAFENEMNKSQDVKRLETLLSDRESVKAAKKYLQLLRLGS